MDNNNSIQPSVSHGNQEASSQAISTETITQQITDATAQTLRLRLTKNPNKLQRRVNMNILKFILRLYYLIDL
jgi:hypothetical protein